MDLDSLDKYLINFNIIVTLSNPHNQILEEIQMLNILAVKFY